MLDVEEDGLRWTWQLNLDFRGKTREEFTVDVPAAYVVEKVEGANVRGWQIEKKPAGQTVKITLLKAAKDGERITLALSKAAAIGQGGNKEFAVPLLQLSQAALHTGQILIRRSPLLDLRTLDRAGMTRSDIPHDLAKQVGAESVASPLNVQSFEAYTFDRNPAAAIRLAAEPVTAKMTADVQSILKILDANRSLDCRIALTVKDRPVYRLQMYLPDDFRLDRLLPGDFEYAITMKNERRLLTIFSTSGRSGDFEVHLQGTLGKSSGPDKISLPHLEVLGVERQQGDIAVQASDAYEVEACDLKNCEKVLLDRFYGWLKPEQRPLTRLALHYRAGDYRGAVRLTPKKPEVTCDTLSNVRVTDRAIEETMLLDFMVKNAGVRKFSFLLPWWMKDAKINVPLLREKSNEPLAKGNDKSPRLVKIELQVEALGLHRVLVENDRQLENTPQEAPIPKVNDVSVCRRYLTLESYGRDEILVDDARLAGMEKLLPGQKDWTRLKEMLGRPVTFAYLVAPDAAEPKLVYQANERAAVQTAKARILFAQTDLAIDKNGAYRAKQYLRLFNSTEQFLEIELPLGAELWTAQVAGEPAKPVQDNPQDPRGVKIPLVKTAAGDLDYTVVFGYGGKMPAMGKVSTFSFPLARCVNVTPELSHVRLYVPGDRQWFDFGGTMRLVDSEADMAAEQVAVNKKRIDRLQQAFSQENSKYEKIRAAANINNMQQIGLALHNFHDERQNQLETNAGLEKEIAANDAALQAAQKAVSQLENTPQKAGAEDNRGKIHEYYMNQTNGYVGKTLVQAGSNWSEVPEAKPQQGGEGPMPAQQFNDAWLGQNSLLNAPAFPTETAKAPRKRETPGPLSELDDDAGKGGKSFSKPSPKPSAAQVAQGKFKRELSESNAQQQSINLNGTLNITGNEQAEEEQRYKDRVARQQSGQSQQSVQTWNFNGNLAATSTGANMLYPTPPPPPMQAGFRIAGPSALPGFGPQTLANPTPPGLGRLDGTPPSPTAAPNAPPAVPGVESSPYENQYRTPTPTAHGGPSALPSPTGLASLDFQLPIPNPDRWSVYRFTTPRGEVEITARSISNELLRRLGYAAGTLAVVFLIGYVIRRTTRGNGAGFISPLATTLMIALGFLALILGVLPVLGIIAIIAGIALKILRPKTKTVPAK